MPKSAKKNSATSLKAQTAAPKRTTPSKSKQLSRIAAKPSKQSCVAAMLRSPKGATIDAMMKATGWQRHSVRGFLAGVIRKRLKLTLNSEVIDGDRIYRIATARTSADRKKAA